MGQHDPLALTREDHAVVADDRAAPQRGETDVPCLARAGETVAAARGMVGERCPCPRRRPRRATAPCPMARRPSCGDAFRRFRCRTRPQAPARPRATSRASRLTPRLMLPDRTIGACRAAAAIRASQPRRALSCRRYVGRAPAPRGRPSRPWRPAPRNPRFRPRSKAERADHPISRRPPPAAPPRRPRRARARPSRAAPARRSARPRCFADRLDQHPPHPTGGAGHDQPHVAHRVQLQNQAGRGCRNPGRSRVQSRSPPRAAASRAAFTRKRAPTRASATASARIARGYSSGSVTSTRAIQ